MEFIAFNALLTHIKALKIGLTAAPKTPLRKNASKKPWCVLATENGQNFCKHFAELELLFKKKMRVYFAIFAEVVGERETANLFAFSALNYTTAATPSDGDTRRRLKALAGCKSLDATFNWETSSASHSIHSDAQRRRMTAPLSMRIVLPGEARLDESGLSRLSISRSSLRSMNALDPPQKRQKHFSCFCRRNDSRLDPPPEDKLEVVLHQSLESDFYSRHSSDEEFLPEVQRLLTPRREGNLL